MFSYRLKIYLDRTVGFLFSLVLAVVARIVGIIMRRDHSVPEHPRSIVVAKFVGLGSMVYTGILCRTLKERFPDTPLIYLTTKKCKEQVLRMRCADDVLTVDDSGIVAMCITNILTIFRLWTIRPDLYFDLEVYSTYAAIMANFSLARNRYGFYRKSAAFKKGLHNYLIFFNTGKHISEIYFQMARAVGIEEGADADAQLFTTAKDQQECALFLEKIGQTDRPLVLINVNASELLLERRWSPENWANFLGKAIQSRPDFRYLLVGAPDERAYVESVRDLLTPEEKEHIPNVAGQLSFGAYLHMIRRSILMITIDSGPLHLAAALGTPTISLWGPGDPNHYAPKAPIHRILYEPVYCSPCLYHTDFPPCNGNNICMQAIRPDALLREFDRFTRENEESRATQ